MTHADLRGLLLERAKSRSREMLVLAWRTAYYGRVDRFPELRDEMDDLDQAFGGRRGEDDVDDEGAMSRERHDRIWERVQGYFRASNARFAGA